MKQRGFELVSRVVGDTSYQLPMRMTKRSPAYDFFSPLDVVIKPNEKVKIPTGVKAFFQFGEGLFIITRSSLGTKYQITLANNIALVDPDYYNNSDNEGEIFVFLANEGKEDFVIKQGDRFCQAFFLPVLLADDDNVFEAGREGGLGSTGK
ncbi:dUTP diphosphatase [Candidatus Woesearchaeota archaeon]|nr:dUTP diphosphatase [Candidatus Woesearchaeota archaeon]